MSQFSIFRIFGLDEGINLIPDGDNELVTIHNVEDYLSLTLDLALNKGIKKQMDAFRAGFNQVFPLEKLAPFRYKCFSQILTPFS